MSSSDEEAPHSPELGASSSKGPPPALDAESEASDDGLDKRVRKVSNKSYYKRPRIEWRAVLHFVKGDEATMGEDEMKLRITEAYNKIMENSKLVRLPGHVEQETNRG